MFLKMGEREKCIKSLGFYLSDLFQNMTVREAKIASLTAYPEDLKQGELLFSQGDIGDEMYVILDGSISIFLEKNGKRTVLVRLEKGNTFGEMGLFRKAERSASAEAAEKTRLLVVNRDCLDPLKKRNPKIAAKLFLNCIDGITIFPGFLSLKCKRSLHVRFS